MAMLLVGAMAAAQQSDGTFIGNPAQPVRFVHIGAGSDLGASVNLALASFGAAPACGAIFIPTGNYSFATTIDFTGRIGCDLRGYGYDNTRLTFTGSGPALQILYSAATAQQARLNVHDFELLCSGCSGDGIFIQDSWFTQLYGLYITNFPASNAAIHYNGSNTSGRNVANASIHNNVIRLNNGDGVLVDGAGGGAVIKITDSDIDTQGVWNVHFAGSAAHNAATISSNDLDGGGSGGIWLNGCTQCLVASNHLEQTGRSGARHRVVLQLCGSDEPVLDFSFSHFTT